MKYYIIAGEASGDMHGANLMKAIIQKDKLAQFRFWGGDKMAAVGGEQVMHYKNTAFMGFWEVIKNLKTILSFIKKAKEDILHHQPDVLILIDYPGFNMRIAKMAKNAGFKVVYYISPQVWAWKENRVNQIKKYVDKMLVILPFEKAFYEQKWHYSVDYVGHPLLDEIANQKMIENDFQHNEKLIIALLPGSRMQEIQTILPQFLKMVPHFPDYHFVVAGLPHIPKTVYTQLIGTMPVELAINKTYPLLHYSYAALVASGTATLETALYNTPMLVGYKGNWLSYLIGKRLVNVKYISLVNLIMDAEIVPELIQQDLNEDKLKSTLAELLTLAKQYEMRQSFIHLKHLLGNSGASERAAELIVNQFKI